MTASDGGDRVELEVLLTPADIRTLVKYARRGPQRTLAVTYSVLLASGGAVFVGTLTTSDPFWLWYGLTVAWFAGFLVIRRLNARGRFELQRTGLDGHFTATNEGVVIRRPKSTIEFLFIACLLDFTTARPARPDALVRIP